MYEYLEILIPLLGFMLPLQLAQQLFAWKDSKKEQFVSRIIVSELIYLAAAVGIVVVIVFGWITSSNVLMYLIVYGLSFFVIKFCYSISNIEVVFVTTCGYAVQHMGYSLFAILWFYFGSDSMGIIVETIWDIFIQLITILFAYLIIIRKTDQMREKQHRDPMRVGLAVVVLFISIYLSLWTTVETDEVGVFSNVICKIYAIIASGLVIGIEYNISKVNMLNKQNELMDQMIHTQGSHFQMSQESISIINRKCHDIKYQMKAMTMMSNGEKKQEYLEGLRRAISIYDSVYHTENDVLNLLLREKTLICDEYQILFSCMADGKILSFIKSDDLYILLGNALDNAVESVLKEEDVTKRVISMNVGKKMGMVCIHLENYCNKTIKFDNGLPITTKKDKNYHGFGVQSIQFLVDKYNGNLMMQQEGDTFYLDMFFNSKG
ncbi:MAG: GHKL domain-containing protein [Dysgonomonas sp.]